MSRFNVILYCTTVIGLAFFVSLARSDSGQSIAKLFAQETTSTAPTTTATMNPNNQCNLRKSSRKEKDLLAVIDKLTGMRFTVNDTDHMYSFGVCIKANDAAKDDEGLVQTNMKTNNAVVIGRLGDVDVEGTPYSIRLAYKNGDKYPNACNRTLRTAVIYFICSTTEKFSMIEENNDRDEDCGYIFELQTPVVCSSSSPCVQPPPTSPSTTTTTTTTPSTTTSSTSPATTSSASSTVSTTTTSDNHSSTTNSSDSSAQKASHWGVFSVVFIVLISVAVVYLLLGTVYLRFVRKARGWEQVPHWYVWHSIGNKSADCCNYICRCGQRQSEVHSYENINDRMSDDDENLLNM